MYVCVAGTVQIIASNKSTFLKCPSYKKGRGQGLRARAWWGVGGGAMTWGRCRHDGCMVRVPAWGGGGKNDGEGVVAVTDKCSTICMSKTDIKQFQFF
jgi:hypothetical protein